MRKIILGSLIIVLITFCATTNLSAQAFAKENFVANAGISLGGGGYYAGASSSVGVSFSLEKGFMETGEFGIIGIGGIVGYRSGTFDRNSLLLGPRATYHFSIIPVEKLDVYAVVETDIIFFSGNDARSNTVELSLIAAARYYFSENFGAFVELGINGYSDFTGGLSYKF